MNVAAEVRGRACTFPASGRTETGCERLDALFQCTHNLPPVTMDCEDCVQQRTCWQEVDPDNAVVRVLDDNIDLLQELSVNINQRYPW